MWGIFSKEVNLFLSSYIGYIAMGVFLLFTGAWIWIFPGIGILDGGFASMRPFFDNAPIVFLFLIPAITMRAFAEEKQAGTIELLSTKPVSDLGIVLGKFFACWLLVAVALLPTLMYVFSVYQLGYPVGNIDLGAVAGSYFGLLFLGAAFVGIGLFTSSLTSNQIIAFILAMLLCFVFFLAFDMLSSLPVLSGRGDSLVQNLGILHHYESISRGLLDTRDLVYFVSIIVLFILLTKTSLERRKW